MRALLLATVLAGTASAAECPRVPFISGASDALPPIGRLFVFWPKTKKPSAPALTVELPVGVSVPFALQRLDSAAGWDAYALTVVAEPKMYYRVDGAGPRRAFYAEAHWRKPVKADAYRLEWTEKGKKRVAVLPPDSKCFPWPAGAKATALLADGHDEPL